MLISNGPLLTFDPSAPFFERGGLLLQGPLIREVGDARALLAKYPREEVLDAEGGLILPGLIDAHTHLYGAFARGIALKDPPPENFVQVLERLWWRLDRALELEDVGLSALVGISSYLRNGTTTIIDHHASPSAIEGSLDGIAEAMRSAKIRGVLCYEVTDRNGKEGMEAGVRENVRFLKGLKGAREEGLVRGLFGLHAPLTLSDESLARCREAGESLKREGIPVGFHVHVSEHQPELEDSLTRYGKRPLRRLYDAGVLGPLSIAAHCIHIDEGDMELLKDTKTACVHNPQSNMNNAVGCAPVLELMKKGVLTCLGTDGMTGDLFSAARAAFLLQRHEVKDPRVAWRETETMLTAKNPEVAGRYFPHPVGVLKAGAYADIVISDYRPQTPLTGENFWGHLLYGAAGLQARTVVVNGEVVMRDRVPLHIDEDEVFARARERAKKVWERF